MRVAFSNIAWRVDEDAAVARLLASVGLDAVEIAPTRNWPKPLEVPRAEVQAYAQWWREQGLAVVSLQALLFGRPDLTIFGSAEIRAATASYLGGILELAADIGARRLVFGSPGNRKLGALTAAQALPIAVEFFGQLGQRAESLGVELCIEPNPVAYGCDWVTTAAEGLAVVQAVASPGFGLHLDSAGMLLGGDDPAATVRDMGSAIRHFHASAPQLGHVHRGGPVDYPALAQALRDVQYQGVVSIEMRAQAATGDNRPFIAETAGMVRGLFG